jgi:hypothetical protein
MADNAEIDRIAAALNALRPEWPIKSLRTLLTRDHANRAYADLAVAAVYCAVDPKTATPARLAEHGPWWVAAAQTIVRGTETPGPGLEPRCEKDGHEHELARACRCCRAEAIAVRDEDAA